MFSIGLAEVFLYLLPMGVGIVAGQRLKPLANLCVMFLTMYGAIVANATWKTGKFEPLAVLGSMFSFPGIALPLLVIAWVAVRFSRRPWL